MHRQICPEGHCFFFFVWVEALRPSQQFFGHVGITGTRSMIAVCYGYRIKLYRINIIRDMVMQLNFTYLPKTVQYSKHMVASQTSWL